MPKQTHVEKLHISARYIAIRNAIRNYAPKQSLKQKRHTGFFNPAWRFHFNIVHRKNKKDRHYVNINIRLCLSVEPQNYCRAAHLPPYIKLAFKYHPSLL